MRITSLKPNALRECGPHWPDIAWRLSWKRLSAAGGSAVKPVVYLAGPLGFAESGRDFQNCQLIPLIKGAGFDVLNPWELTSKDLIRAAADLEYGIERRRKWQEVNFTIGTNNAEAIRRSDLLVAVLDGPDVDSGTAAEIGFASALGKPIVGYRSDLRISADNEGATVNLQVEYFVRKTGGTIVRDLDSLREELALLRTQFKD